MTNFSDTPVWGTELPSTIDPDIIAKKMAMVDKSGNPVKLYLELAKIKPVILAMVTAVIGFILGSHAGIEWVKLISMIVGGSLALAGSAALNQWMEIDRDAKMVRTMNRPLPTKRLDPTQVLIYSMLTLTIGLFLLYILVDPLTALIALIGAISYVLLYTPMKPISVICTLVGGISGSIPPVLGWTAASGVVEPGALILGAILYIWQIPHFLALVCLYRIDYLRGGFKMLPVIDMNGSMTGRMIILYTLALIPVTLGITIAGISGWYYLIGAIILGLGFLVLGIRLYFERTTKAARRLFLASVIYLPLLLILMLVDQASIV
ncbi:MAG TPA: heme o synthase [bacterium]|jgi:protoheme IX farnesyltransferase